MDLVSFLIQCLNSVQYGLLLFLVASGLTLIFGIMGVINLAHGSFYMLGAYLAFTLASLTGNLFIALPLGVVLAVAFGYAGMGLLQLPVPARPPAAGADDLWPDPGLRGVAQHPGGRRCARRAVPAAGRSLPIGNDMTYPVYRLFISAVCLLVAGAMYYVIAAPAWA
jgi:branched-chain amino acid transport system permease protein